MKKSTVVAILGATLVLSPLRVSAQSSVVQSQPMNSGNISPMLFGNFIELLDDVVPGMWAEMLNDRCFEGIAPMFNGIYYDGAQDICDRDWDTNATWSFDTTEAFSSTRSGKLASTGTNMAYVTQSGLSVQQGMQYNFSGYFRAGSGGGTMTAQLLAPTSSNQNQWTVLASAPLSGLTAGQWQKLTAQMVSSAQTDQGVFKLQIQGGGPVWVDKLSLMPANNLEGWRPDVITAVSNAHPAVVRWGGSEVDPGAYKWTNGIGSRDLRLPFPNAAWGRIDPNDVGIDEFCQFCALVGATPLICVSFADGAQSAGNMAQYCNGATNTVWGAMRAANGHPAPYAVPYFQIGNEISGDNTTYLSEFASFVQLMKASDPTIQILSSFPTQNLLTQQGTNLNFVAPHYYTTDISGDSGSVDANLTSLTGMINSTPGCSNVLIATTEWNATGGSWGLGRATLGTLSTALLNANYLNVLMRHSDKVRIACRSGMANSFFGGFIKTAMSGVGVTCQPAYYTMQLYSRHVGAKPIPLTVSQPGNGIDVFACSTTNYQSLAIFAVNANTTSTPFSFTLTGFQGSMGAVSAETVCDTQNAGETDVGNHWPSPNRVQIVPVTVAPNSVILPPLSATAIECGQVLSNAPAAPILTHRYNFASNGNDLVGGANGTLLGGATVSGGHLNLSGSGWMSLPPGTLDTNYNGGLTVEAWATASQLPDGQAAALWSFGNTTSYGRILTHDAANNSSIDYNSSAGSVAAVQPGPVAGAVQLAGIWSPTTGDLRLYENGELVENNIMAGLPLSLMTGANDQTNVIGANIDGTLAWTGSIQEFRVYTGELTPAQIRTSLAAGSGNPIIDAGAIQSVSVALHPNFIYGTIQDPIVFASSATVTNINLATLSDVAFASSNTNILNVLPSGQVQAVGVGTATLTATYQGVSGQTNVTTLAAPAVLMTHRYSFVSDASDSISGENGALMGGATASNGLQMSITLGDGASTRGQYLDLPRDIVAGYPSMSLEMWVNLKSTGAYARHWSFGAYDVNGNDASGVLMFDTYAGVGLCLNLNPDVSLDGTQGYDNLAISYSDDNQGLTYVAGVIDSVNHLGSIYTNGALAASMAFSHSLTAVDLEHCVFGRSLHTGDAFLNGTINEARIYYGVLSAGQVATNYLLGPTVPGLVEVTLTSSPTGYQINWPAGTLQSAPALTGPWTPVTGATPPYSLIPSSSGTRFYRVKVL
jgi:alpha-N-arabinofuranosidase